MTTEMILNGGAFVDDGILRLAIGYYFEGFSCFIHR
jgi:hypothetical protein